MNRFFFVLKALILLTFLPSAARADEGMWTLMNLPKQVYAVMQQEGLRMPYDALYNDSLALKNAVVDFGDFCSGVVVSSDGLVFTNHHCGFEAIRSHSTVEHDYMLNGFSAQSYQDELPNERLFVRFMVRQEDITKQVEQAGYYALDPEARAHLIDSLEEDYNKKVKLQDDSYHASIDAFYEGNAWIATTYQTYEDVRLVFAIPKSMGKFGGETDNWMWPRQTCDFSVFRIYADKNNRPAKYSPDNVPFHPKRWAKVSLKGYKEGDYAMTMGYPGSTSRYLSSYGIRERRDARNEPRAQVRGVKQEVMTRHMRASEAVRIKYDSKFANSANYWKNSIGMNKCIDSIGLVQQKQQYEQRIRHYQDSTGYLRGQLDLDLLQRLYDKRQRAMKAMTYFSETFGGTSEFNTRAMRVRRMKQEKDPKDSTKVYVEVPDNGDTWDADLDMEVQAVLLKNYREHVGEEFLPAFYQTIDTKFHGDYQKYVDYLWKKSQLMKPAGTKIYVNSKDFAKDPGVSYGQEINEMMRSIYDRLAAGSDTIAEQERLLCQAKLRMEEDLPHYSDANFTLRLSYGQVGGFLLGGKPSGYYTTAESLVEKMDQGDRVVDYKAEPKLRTLMAQGDYGRYADPVTGKLQLCFLTNNDITGGNSGSPMFDAEGRLIGLAFDGNWDSLASDILFDRVLARCIGVDIRYVLFMMDRWGHADRLLRSLSLE